MVDAGDFKHELLNRLRSTMAVNVLITLRCYTRILLNLQWKPSMKTSSVRVEAGTVSE